MCVPSQFVSSASEVQYGELCLDWRFVHRLCWFDYSLLWQRLFGQRLCSCSHICDCFSFASFFGFTFLFFSLMSANLYLFCTPVRLVQLYLPRLIGMYGFKFSFYFWFKFTFDIEWSARNKWYDANENGLGFILFHATTTPSRDMVRFSSQTLLRNYLPPKTNRHFFLFFRNC